MTPVEILDAACDRAGGYKVDLIRGELVGRVSSEWFARPADERYFSLSELFAAVRSRTEHGLHAGRCRACRLVDWNDTFRLPI